MAVLPTVPTFVTNDTSLTRLQQLSAAVAFLSDLDIKPAFHVYKTGTSSITLNTWTTVPGGTLAYDSDNFFSAGVNFNPTIQTQGYYAFEGLVPWLTGITGIAQRCAFLFTAGSSNPGFTAGTTVRFGMRGGSSTSTASNDTVQCTADEAPMALYTGDRVAFQVWADTTTTLNNNNNLSYISGRFVPNYTGHWLRTAP
jgi:hypothetical protein